MLTQYRGTIGEVIVVSFVFLRPEEFRFVLFPFTVMVIPDELSSLSIRIIFFYSVIEDDGSKWIYSWQF